MPEVTDLPSRAHLRAVEDPTATQVNMARLQAIMSEVQRLATTIDGREIDEFFPDENARHEVNTYAVLDHMDSLLQAAKGEVLQARDLSFGWSLPT